MAYKDSDEIATNSNYALGDYSFRIERSSVPGSTNDKIEAICTQGGKNARKSIQLPSTTQMDGWYVEANDTTADVYVIVRESEGGDSKTSSLNTSIKQPIGTYAEVSEDRGWSQWTYSFHDAVVCPVIFTSGIQSYFIASQSATVHFTETAIIYGQESTTEREIGLSYAGNVLGKSFYYSPSALTLSKDFIITPSPISGSEDGTTENSAYTMLYGTPSGGEYGNAKEMLIGRFAIDLEDAGGVGPGSGWIDPGDYDPDWEEGDPTHTLYVTVIGALSGRHNDPIEDPSYSYIPADKETVKDYGCGGDGGHGGGGGAGASTVVVHKFATNQANSKEVTAIVRRHGYGSGGGKGGKGGDGCILIYY